MCMCRNKAAKMGDWQYYIGLKGMILTEQPVNNKTPIQFTTVDGRNPTPIMVDSLFIPLFARFLDIPGWLALGFMNHQQ